LTLLLSLFFVTTASAEDVNKNNNSLVQSYGNIKYVMLLGNYSDPVTVEEINDVTNLMITSYRENNKNTGERLIFPVAERSSGTIILACCFSINENGVTSAYTGKTDIEDGNQDERTLEIIHEKAEEWYDKQVVKNLNSTSFSGNCSPENTRRVLTPDEVMDIFENSTWTLPDDWMGGGKLNYPEDDEINSYRTSDSICNWKWMPSKYPLLMW
jgi:hypothetical protein